MIITHARRSDLPDILELERSGFDPAEQWSETAWAEELDSPDRYVLARLDRDARIIGVATFSRVEEIADLLRVIVHPDVRGRGVGASLIRAGLEWAAAVGARRMLLEVRPDNDPAIALYRGLGFEAVTT
ncbi:MAG: ribosomal-protein-alanine N-acetyltransferase, partial [Phenylobacterium zucineum]